MDKIKVVKKSPKLVMSQIKSYILPCHYQMFRGGGVKEITGLKSEAKIKDPQHT